MRRNEDVRDAIERKRLKHYEVASELGIDPGTFSRWLRVDLTDGRKRKILDAIEKIQVQ